MLYETIESKLRALAECGFKLRSEYNSSNVVEICGREVLEKPGFELLFECLAMDHEHPPWTSHCENLWHFDAECIEHDGSYVNIAKRMSEMTRGSLALSHLQDSVDIAEGKAWLSFTCDGVLIQLECEVQDDWVDPNIFGVFVDLLAQHDSNKLFLFYELGGQDCIIGCTTRTGFEKLKALIPKVERLT